MIYFQANLFENKPQATVMATYLIQLTSVQYYSLDNKCGICNFFSLSYFLIPFSCSFSSLPNLLPSHLEHLIWRKALLSISFEILFQVLTSSGFLLYFSNTFFSLSHLTIFYLTIWLARSEYWQSLDLRFHLNCYFKEAPYLEFEQVFCWSVKHNLPNSHKYRLILLSSSFIEQGFQFKISWQGNNILKKFF